MLIFAKKNFYSGNFLNNLACSANYGLVFNWINLYSKVHKINNLKYYKTKFVRYNF